MKRLVLFFCMLLVPFLWKGQNTIGANRSYWGNVKSNLANPIAANTVGTATDYWSLLNEGVTPPSPNASSLGIFGNIPIDLYRGTARYDIPLYTLKSAYLELPITLGYASNGLKVDEISSNIGLGWALFTGGIINRTVYQLPDESAGYRFESKWLDSPSPFDSTNTYRNDLAEYILRSGDTPYFTDGQLDIFNYNMSGLSGSFVLNEQLIPQVIKGNGQVKIEFNQLANQFIISDTKGIKYYFTVTESNLANSQHIFDKYKYLDSPSTIRTPPHSLAPLKSATTAWFIKKIIHPQGDSLIFEYTTGEESFDYGYHEEIRAFSSSDRQAGETDDYNLLRHMMTFGYNNTQKNTQYIKKITASNNNTIVFNYTNSPRLDMVSGGVLMTGFTVKHQSTVIKKYTFTQIAKLSSKNSEINLDGLRSPGTDLQYRYFLTKVSENSRDSTNELSYTFDYNDLDNLPHRFLRAQDYGGFYNGSTDNRLAPCIVSGYGPAVQVTANNSNRAANLQYAQKGILNKITYPTGGTTLITYEANICGLETYPGIRVSKTEDTPGGGAPVVVRKYYYNDFAGRNTPSGSQNLNQYDFIDQTVNYYIRPCIIPGDGGVPYPPEPSYYTYNYIMYYSSAKNYFSEVYSGIPSYPIVTISYGGTNFESGGTTTYFRDMDSDGCSYLSIRQIKFGVVGNSAMYNGEKEQEVAFKVESGTQKILTDKRYTYREVTTYSRSCMVTNNQFPDDVSLCGISFIPTNYDKAQNNYSLGVYKIYGKVLLLDQVTSATYDQNGQNPVEQSQTYSYNSLYQKASVTTTGSDNKIRQEQIRYASDYFNIDSSSPYYEVFNTLKNRNGIDYPVEQVQFVGNNLVSAQLNIYDFGSNEGVNIVQQYELPISTPITSHTFFNGSSYAPGYKKIWDFQYNTGNKLKEVIYKGTQKKAIVWGYQNCHVVAEVENASFSSLGVDDQPFSESLPIANENTIRNLSNTLVTTYIYEPLTGITSTTDPNGKTIHYEYDNFGRLKFTKDDQWKIMKRFNYHYSTAN